MFDNSNDSIVWTFFHNLEMNFEKALDENFDGFIAKGNNNFIEIILDGQGTFLVCPQYNINYRGGAW